MYISNCIIDTDSIEYPAQHIIVARFKHNHSASLTLRKWGKGKYTASISTDALPVHNVPPDVTFDSSGRGIEINFNNKQGIGLVSTALVALVEAIDFWEEGDQITASVAEIIEALPNHTDNVHDEKGRPRQQINLLEKGRIRPIRQAETPDHRLHHALHVHNLNEFMASGVGHSPEHKSPFSVLAELEAELLKSKQPEPAIIIDYSDSSYVLFEQVAAWSDGYRTVYEYQFSSTGG